MNQVRNSIFAVFAGLVLVVGAQDPVPATAPSTPAAAETTDTAAPDPAAPETAPADELIESGKDATTGDTAPEPATTVAEGTKTAIDSIKDNPIVFWIVVAQALCSVLVLAALLERLLNLRSGRSIPSGLAGKLKTALASEGPEAALAICKSSSSHLSRLAAAGLAKIGKGHGEVSQGIATEGAFVKAELRRNASMLDSIGQVAPLLGLLGTVVGMIQAFIMIATADAMGQADKLAAGISNALVTTAIGLTIAIPAVLLATWVLSKGDAILRNLSKQLEDIFSSDLATTGDSSDA